MTFIYFKFQVNPQVPCSLSLAKKKTEAKITLSEHNVEEVGGQITRF